MNRSMIIDENEKIDTEGLIITYHSTDYFNIKKIYPEVSGFYECLFDLDSPYREDILNRHFIPTFFYDNDTMTWYHSQSGSNSPFDVKKAKIIGWRMG